MADEREADTDHPYLGSNSRTLATAGVHLENTPLTIQARFSFSMVDTDCGRNSDYVRFVREDGTEVGSRVRGFQAGPLTTDWMTAATTIRADFVTNSTNRKAVWTGEDFSCQLCTGGCVPTEYTGVALDSYEYRVFESQPVWTSMRFPGHRVDEETGLYENWHRYYDPSIGRYLQPEPLMASPDSIVEGETNGRRMHAYSYAANNPLRYTDPTGRDIWIEGGGPDDGVPGHLRIAVGDPFGEYRAFSYEYTGNKGAGKVGNLRALLGLGTTGQGYEDDHRGGRIDWDRYVMTDPNMDKLVTKMLRASIDDPAGPYSVIGGTSCRGWVQKQFDAVQDYVNRMHQLQNAELLAQDPKP